jgi:predicted membrane protein
MNKIFIGFVLIFGMSSLLYKKKESKESKKIERKKREKKKINPNKLWDEYIENVFFLPGNDCEKCEIDDKRCSCVKQRFINELEGYVKEVKSI